MSVYLHISVETQATAYLSMYEILLFRSNSILFVYFVLPHLETGWEKYRNTDIQCYRIISEYEIEKSHDYLEVLWLSIIMMIHKDLGF